MQALLALRLLMWSLMIAWLCQRGLPGVTGSIHISAVSAFEDITCLSAHQPKATLGCHDSLGGSTPAQLLFVGAMQPLDLIADGAAGH